MSREKRPGGRGTTVRNVLVFAIALFAALFVTGMLYVNGMVSRINRTETKPKDVVAAEDETFLMDDEEAQEDTLTANDVAFDIENIQVMDSNEIKNLLLIGQDARAGEERQRSDSMIICSINTKENKITLTSLMRDMYVPIPGYSDNRINAAYAFGGMDLLDNTIEQDFGVHIDGNIEVDFEGFIEAIAVVGDLEIELTDEEARYLNNRDWSSQGTNNSSWNLTAGVNHLDPEQALAYSRIRDIGNSDYERTDRQRKVVMQAFRQAKEGGLMSMLSMAKEIAPYLTTDMTNSELMGYVGTIASLNISDSESFRLPAEGTFTGQVIRGMSVLVPDLQQNSTYLKECIYGE